MSEKKIEGPNKLIDIDDLKHLKLYKIAQALPKGVLLHVHLGAAVNMINFIKFLKEHHNDIYKNIYVLMDKQKLEAQKIYINKNIIPVLNASDPNKSQIEQILALGGYFPAFNPNHKYTNDYLLAYYPNGPISDGFEQLCKQSNVDYILNQATRIRSSLRYRNWDRFDSITYRFSHLIKHEDIFHLYFKYLLDNIGISDNILGIELKSNLGKYFKLEKVYDYIYNDTKYEIYTHNTSGEMYGDVGEVKIMTDIIQERSLKCKIHIGHLRIKSIADLSTKCKNTQIKSPFLNAIDIIAEENPPKSNTFVGTNADFIPPLLNACSDLNLSLHSGEYSLIEDMQQEYIGINNIIDVLVLKKLKEYKQLEISSQLQNVEKQKIRVGHGIALFDYPDIIALYKKEQIHIELNPISNLIMGHTTDLSNHPGRTYVKQGLRVSINSDDGSIFNYDNVSVDWLFVLGLWNLTIDEIYFICKCSIEDSFFSQKEKDEMLLKFNRLFDEWYFNNKNELHAAIQEALPILASYKSDIYTRLPDEFEMDASYKKVYDFDDINSEIDYRCLQYNSTYNSFSQSILTKYFTKMLDQVYPPSLEILIGGGSYCKSCKNIKCNCMKQNMCSLCNNIKCNCMKQNMCSSCNENKQKYLKYKSKYLTIKNDI